MLLRAPELFPCFLVTLSGRASWRVVEWACEALLVGADFGDRRFAGRKGFGQELKEKVTPQEEKSTVDKIKETFTGAGDKAQRDV